ncbi:MAG TPA: dihydrodipicolinate synthase family protein [Thermoleophilia bacterium]|nr:dihydrodipicolinate synthase family protein [Thermoleophilia bacterium]
MSGTQISLRGVFTPIVASFDETGVVAHEKMAENLERWNGTGLKGYVVLGSNGEWVFLDEKERLEVLETARQAIGGDKLLIAGAAAESTRHTIALTEAAATAGADAAIVVNPSYYRGQMTPPILADYYRAVADESPIPIVIYNLPPATGIDLPAALLVELSHHPNIIGVKDTGGDVAKMGETLRQADGSFEVLAGSASFFYPTQAMGVAGGVLALANIAPDESVALYDLFHAGLMDEGRELHLRMLPVNLAVTSRFGVSGLKAAMDMLGFYGGPPRLPLRPLAEQQRGELRSILRQADLLSSD